MDATIILLDESSVTLQEWQRMYNLTVGSSKIGRFFDIGEPGFRDGLTISEGVIRMLDVTRYIRNKVTNINSLDRSKEDRARLIREGYQPAENSPHEWFLAADIDTVSESDTMELVDCLYEAADILGYQIRLGYKKYLKQGNTFVHMDICPMYFRKGKVWNENKHPIQWEYELEW